VRIARVKSLTNNNLKLKEAVDQVLQQPGITTYQGDSTLPLARVSVKGWGVTQGWMRLEYFRRVIGSITQPNQLIARFRTGIEPIEWFTFPTSNNDFTTNGLPGTQPRVTMLFGAPTDIKGVARSWTWNRPGVRFFVPAVLNNNPIGQVFSRLQTINSDAVVFGGFTSWPPFTIRFNSVSVDVIETSAGGVQFDVLYDFSAVRGGWYRELPDYTTSGVPKGPTEGAWVIRRVLEFQQKTFSGAFPY
jgi:hypothetical protein